MNLSWPLHLCVFLMGMDKFPVVQQSDFWHELINIVWPRSNTDWIHGVGSPYTQSSPQTQQSHRYIQRLMIYLVHDE